MPALSIDHWDALQEVAHVENALLDGFPPPSQTKIGSHERGALRKAADDLGIDYQALRRRVGLTRGDRGAIARSYPGLKVDWSLYRPCRTYHDITDEDARKAIEAANSYPSHYVAAAALGISVRTLHRRIRIGAERGFAGYSPVLPGFRISRSSTSFDSKGNVTAEHVQQKPEVGDEFEMPAGQILKGVSALVDAEGRIIQQWVKTKTDSVTNDLIEALKNVFEEYDGHAPLIPPATETHEELLSVYPIADQHNGLLAWAKETGENYDLKIAANRLRSCMSQLVSQSPQSKDALIINLGDWQHTDDMRNITPRTGNILDVDSRYFKILTTGVKLMQDCIELALQRHQHVLVRNLPGNHDPHASIALTVALAAFYSSNPRVTIDDEPGDWFFHRFGQTLLGATHGHNAKPRDMAMTMAVRCREDWGQTKYHWCIAGHIHHETAREVGDVRCETFQSLAANDAYSVSRGYVAGKSLVSITLHSERGEIGRHRVNVPPPTRETKHD